MPRKTSASTSVEIETCMAAAVVTAPGRLRVFPAGWVGAVPSSIADQLRDHGALADTDAGLEPEAPVDE